MRLSSGSPEPCVYHTARISWASLDFNFVSTLAPTLRLEHFVNTQERLFELTWKRVRGSKRLHVRVISGVRPPGWRMRNCVNSIASFWLVGINLQRVLPAGLFFLPCLLQNETQSYRLHPLPCFGGKHTVLWNFTNEPQKVNRNIHLLSSIACQLHCLVQTLSHLCVILLDPILWMRKQRF